MQNAVSKTTESCKFYKDFPHLQKICHSFANFHQWFSYSPTYWPACLQVKKCYFHSADSFYYSLKYFVPKFLFDIPRFFYRLFGGKTNLTRLTHLELMLLTVNAVVMFRWLTWRIPETWYEHWTVLLYWEIFMVHKWSCYQSINHLFAHKSIENTQMQQDK